MDVIENGYYDEEERYIESYSGTLWNNDNNNTPFRLYVNWTVQQDISERTSTLNVDVYLDNKNKNTATYSNFDIYVGENLHYSTNKWCAAKTITLIGSFTFTLEHGSSGIYSHNRYFYNEGYRYYTNKVYFRAQSQSSNHGTAFIDATIDIKSIDVSAPTCLINSDYIGIDNASINVVASDPICSYQFYMKEYGGNIISNTWQGAYTRNGNNPTSLNIALPPSDFNIAPDKIYELAVRVKKSTNEVWSSWHIYTFKTIGSASITSADQLEIDKTDPLLRFRANIANEVQNYPYCLSFSYNSSQLGEINNLSFSEYGDSVLCEVHIPAQVKSSLISAIPSSQKNKIIKVTLTQYTDANYTTVFGTPKQRDLNITTTEDSAPTFEDFDYFDTTQNGVGAIPYLTENASDAGILLQNFSQISITTGTAVAKNGAYLKRFEFKAGNLTGTSSQSANSGSFQVSNKSLGKITQSGIVIITVTATDSRGWRTTIEKEVEVIKYEPIKLNSSSIKRRDGIEQNIGLSFSGVAHNITVNGVNKNFLRKVEISWKKISENNYSTDKLLYKWDNYPNLSEVVTNGDDFSYSEDQVMLDYVNNPPTEQFLLDSDHSYDVKLVVRDNLTYHEEYLYVTEGRPTVSLRKGKVGVNNNGPSEALDVIGNMKISGDIIINGVSLQSIINSLNS